MEEKKTEAEVFSRVVEFIAKNKLMPHIYFYAILILSAKFAYDTINYSFHSALMPLAIGLLTVFVISVVFEFFIKQVNDYNEKAEKIRFSKVDISIIKKDGKKICLMWSVSGGAVENNELLPGASLLGYRLEDGLPHDPLEAKRIGKLIINTRKLYGEVIDQDIRPGQTAYYAVFVQGERPPDNIRKSNSKDSDELPYSAMSTAVERAPEGEMAKLARKIRYQELEERLKSKSDQGGSIAEMARKEMEDAVARIENLGEFFKNIKETKEKSREKIKISRMGDEDKEELLEAIDALADEVLDKKIGMGRIT